MVVVVVVAAAALVSTRIVDARKTQQVGFNVFVYSISRQRLSLLVRYDKIMAHTEYLNLQLRKQ